MVNKVPNALCRLLRPSDTRASNPIDNDIPEFASRPAALEQWLKEKEVVGASFSNSYFDTIDMLQ